MNGSSSTAGTSMQVVIGSMERAEEYGAKLTELKSNGGNVQGEMVDRILDKGKLTAILYGQNKADVQPPPYLLHR
jgi:hypothetical protein